MKVMLLADLQLESGQSLGHGEYGVGSRFADQEFMLQQIADIANEEGVRLTILAGDTFDRPKPSPWAILALQDFLRRVQHAVVITGNHDVKSLSLPSVVECFRGEHVDIYDSPTWLDMKELRLSVLPWIPTPALLDGTSSTDRDELNDRAGAVLGTTAQQLGSHDPRDGQRHILVGHWAICGATTATGVGAEVFREPLVPLEALTTGSFDLVAFGHIHKIQVLNEKPPVVYLGSPWVCNFGEAGSPHGVWIYDTETNEMRFVAVKDPREFITFDIPSDVPAASHFALVSELGWDVPDGAVVRVRYQAAEEEARLVDQGRVRSEILAAGASKVFLQPTVVKQSRARLETPQTETLTDRQAVDAWLAHDKPGVEREDRIRNLHDDIRAGTIP